MSNRNEKEIYYKHIILSISRQQIMQDWEIYSFVLFWMWLSAHNCAEIWWLQGHRMCDSHLHFLLLYSHNCVFAQICCRSADAAWMQSRNYEYWMKTIFNQIYSYIFFSLAYEISSSECECVSMSGGSEQPSRGVGQVILPLSRLRRPTGHALSLLVRACR